MAAIGGLNAATGSLLTHAAVILVLVLAIPLVASGRIAGVSLAVLALATAAGFEAVLPLPLAAQYLESSLSAARRLFEIVDGAGTSGTRRQGDTETGRQGDTETGRHGDRETRRQGDTETGGHGDRETRRQGDTETGGHGDRETRRRGDGGHGDRETRRQGDTETSGTQGRGTGGRGDTGKMTRVSPSSPHRPITLSPRHPVSLSFEAVTLRYAPGEPAALDNVTFAVPAGACVAIVGPSGAGKSTLANVLLRFWDYEAGAIRLDGRELRATDPDEVRRQIGVVAQQTYLFNATVRDNLRLARTAATDGEIEAAALRGADS